MRVKIYVEGGGNRSSLLRHCRRGFSEFFRKAGLERQMPSVVACGSRHDAYNRFCTAASQRNPNELPILLVDSESPVQLGYSVWMHLKTRVGDHWDRPTTTSDNQAYLMTQVMETWFLADKDMLKNYFGSDFIERHIREWPRLEEVSKPTVYEALSRATAGCSPQYSKGRVSFELLERLDPSKVLSRCPHAKKLVDYLLSL